MKVERIWNSTDDFIFEDTEGVLYGHGIKNKLLYTFYGGTTIRTIVDDCSYSGPEYLIEIIQESGKITLTIARQTEPSKKIFVFTKLCYN